MIRRRILTIVSLLLAAACVQNSTLAFSSTGTRQPPLDYPFTCNRASLTADFAVRDQLPQTDVSPTDWYQRDEHGHYLNNGRGPAAATLGPISAPPDAGCPASTWEQERILAAALHYLNEPDNPHALQYRHHHIPDWNPPTATPTTGVDPTGVGPSGVGPTGADSPDDHEAGAAAWAAGRGLDCSNFTAWVYNYGLGIKFGGDVHRQYDGTAGPMGQHLGPQGPFQPGDLIYLHPDNNPDIASHVVIYLDDERVIDSRLDAQGLIGVQVRQREGWYRSAVLGGWRPISA